MGHRRRKGISDSISRLTSHSIARKSVFQPDLTDEEHTTPLRFVPILCLYNRPWRSTLGLTQGAAMQKGSLIRSSRRRGPDIWEYRWRESCPGDKRKHRRIVIGSLDTLRNEAAALKAIVALRREINVNDARLRAKPLTLAELIDHYRQRELATENEWKTLSTRTTWLSAKVDRTAVRIQQSQYRQGSRGRGVARNPATRQGQSSQDSKSNECSV